MTGDFVFPRNAFLGFDHIFDALQNIHVHANDGYPPHNVVKIDGEVPSYSIEMAVAGFSKKDISIEVKEHILTIKGNFLIDTGLSDALWLFSKDLDFEKATSVFEDFLGTGINGDVYGERGKIPSLVLGKTFLNQVKVAYPSVKNFDSLALEKNRLGSIGAELLSRFVLLIDYPN